MMRRVFSASLFCTLLILALLTTGLTSLAFANNQARITQSIDDSKVMQLFNNTRPEAKVQANDRGAVADNFALDHVLLMLQRSPEQEQELNQYIDSLNDKDSANFHKWLTAEELGEKYGVAQVDIDTITGWLQYHGFRVNQVYTNRMMIDFSGTAGQLREAFHTSIHNLEVNGEQHIANMNDPKIPVALAPVTKGIVSLNDFKPHAMLKAKPDYTFAGCASSSSLPTEPGTCYAVTPQDNAVIYNINPLWSAGISGQGQTIAVIEDTDTYSGTGDWTTYRSTFGLSSAFPSGTLTTVHPGGCSDPGTNADDGEAALDVEMATMVAPSAAIWNIACPSPATGFGGLIALSNLVNTAGATIANGQLPNVVSVSYGVCETFNGNGGNAAFYNAYQTAAAEGISVFGATGDGGPSACSADFSVGTEYDVASLGISGWTETPFNVAVGGTDFMDTYNVKKSGASFSTYWNPTNTSTYGSAKSYIPEMPWDDSCANALVSNVATSSFAPYGSGTCNTTTFDKSTNYLSTGAAAGGASNCATGAGGTNAGEYGITTPECQGYAKPSWQSAYGVPTDGVRDIPDVSMFAANGDWGHFETLCWSDPSQTSGGAVSCSGAPSTWSGFGGTSVATPTMAGIQALVNQYTGQNWGNPNPIYYKIAQNEYGTQGGSFLGSACNSTNGNPGNCVFNDVTLGDIDVACEDNGTTEEAHCYKPSSTHGVDSTDTVTAGTVLWGGSGYTTAPTCTIAGPTNNQPYLSPTGTTLWAGGTQAACTAAVNASTTTAVWTVTTASTSGVGDTIILENKDTTGGSTTCGPYTLSGASTTAMASGLCTSIGTSCSLASCTSSSDTATLTAKTTGAAGNFVTEFGPATEFNAFYVYVTNTTKGQGPHYVSGITITTAGSGYAPNTPITLTGGGGTGAIAVANTSIGTAPSTYQPAYGAAPGYDLATGLGTVNAYNLVTSSVWSGSATITCTGVPSSAAYNSNFTISCTSGSGIAVSYYASSGSCSNSSSTYTMTSGTGNCTVTASIAQGSPSVTYTVSATPATPVVALSNMTQTYTGSPLSPTCTVTPNSLSYTLTGAPDTLVGGYPVTCTSTATSNYSSNSASGTFTINQAADPLAWTTAPPATAEYGSSFTVAASGPSTGAITYSSDGVVCTNSGATYTMISGSGTCQVTATQAADSNYLQGNLTTGVTAEPAVGSVSVALTSGSNPSNYGQSITFTATVTSDTGAVKGRKTTKRPRDLNGNVAWSANTGCASSGVSGNSPETATCTTSTLAVGTDTVTATYTANDSNHTTANGSINQTVNLDPNTVTFTTPAPSSAEYGSSFTVAASGLGTGAITYTSDGVVCTNSGATYTMISGSGTCTVTATQAADSTYSSASASESVTAAPAVGSVSVALTSGSNPSNFGDSVTFTATVTSDTGAVKGRKTTKRPRDLNGSVAWSSNTGCASSGVSGNSPETATCTTSTLAVGTDTVTATYTANDSNHTTASGNISQTVNPLTNTCTWTTAPPTSAEYGSSFTVAASCQDSNPVTYASDGVVCTNSGPTYTMISGSGSCTVTANQAADSSYPAGSISGSVTAAPAVGSVSVALTSGSNPSNYGDSITFTATVTSDTGAVKGRKTTKRPRDLNGSVAWSGNTGCSTSSVSGNSPETATCTTSILGGGSDTVTATYTASDSNHTTAAGSINQTVSPAANTVTITGAPASAEYGSSFTVSASGLGTGTITYTSDGVVCSNSGPIYTMIAGSGNCTVTATQAADNNYQQGSSSVSVAAAPAVGSVSVTLASGSNPSTYGDSVTFTATVSSDTGAIKGRKTTKRPRDLNGSVSWSANTGCSTSSVSGNPTQTASCTTTILGAGSDTVTATYTASDNNHTTASGSITQNVNQASQTITVTQAAPASAAYNSSFTVSATASSSLAVAISSTGSCSGSGSGSASITMNSGSGSCLVTFSQGGNANYSAATNVNESTNATLASQSITVSTPAPSTAIADSTYTVVASASSSLPITFAAGPSTVCSIASSTATSATVMMSKTAAHNKVCTLTMSQSGNSNYSAAATVIETTTVALASTATYTFTNNGTAPFTYGSTFTVTASSSQTGAVTSTPVIATNTPAICSVGTQTVNGASVTAPVTMLTGSGSCYLKATWAINSVYKGEVEHFTVMAAKVVPSATFTGAPSTESNGGTFVVTAASNETTGTTAVPHITSATASVCSVSAATSNGPGSYQSTVTMKKATGTCTVKATWAATTDYDAVAAIEQSTAATE